MNNFGPNTWNQDCLDNLSAYIKLLEQEHYSANARALELERDRERLEWLVQQEASVCHVMGMWDVWFDEETTAGVHGYGDWREAIDEAMRESNDG